MAEERLCPECGTNLRSNAPEGLCPKCLIKMGLAGSAKAEVTLGGQGVIEGPGTSIGHYQLLELIGEGGMGLVYLAEQQEPVKRRVALKIIKPGMDSREVVARFEAERQTLAVLDHPNIAHVFDAGTTEAGRPYFVMEHVEGRPITTYCDEHKLNVEQRLVPLFPELVPHLREVFEQAEPRTEYVITRYRQANCNLRTQLERIIARAGLKPWPKLFQNLRSTRETELAERWPEHVVCARIGNSKAVARKHYLQVTDEHFERAAYVPLDDDGAAQNAAQQSTAEPCTDSRHIRQSGKFDVKRGFAGCYEASMGRAGFKPA